MPADLCDCSIRSVLCYFIGLTLGVLICHMNRWRKG